jgi:taurine dioxygenase
VDWSLAPLSSGLGAEVSGLDLSQPLDAASVARLREAWLKHLVLLFRGQTLTDEQFMRFSACFGELHRHDNYAGELRHPQHPELLMVKAKSVAGKEIRFGQQWHSDLSFTTRPAMASVLYCRRLPPVGGDTLWSNMYMAYETLSPTMQRFLDGLEAVHDLTNGRSHRGDPADIREANRRRNPPVRQPIVRVHPETGRKALYVSEWMCPRIVGMSEAEGMAILRMLFEHSTQPELVMRQRWKVDDVLMWDNRCTIHMALRDYQSDFPRELLRTSLVGTPSGALLEERAA